MQSFDVFINFDGNCREAVTFYAEVFGQALPEMMTYGQAPDGGIDERDADRILYAMIPIFGSNAMFSDCPSGVPFERGNSIGMTLGSDDKAELTRLFHALKEGGEVFMDLQPTFWSGLYGMVTDKFGILWHLSHFDPNAQA